MKNINEITGYIEKNLTGDLTIDSEVQKFFEQETGISFYEYVKKRRLTLAACNYLNSNIPLKDIAMQYGYASEEELANAFYEYQNISIYKAKSNPVELKFTPMLEKEI